MIEIFLKNNLDVIFFFYGLAFVVLGMSIFIQLRVTKKSKFKLLNILPLLTWFGLTHGLNEFVDMFEIIKGELLLFKVIGPIFLFISYFFIFMFGYQLTGISTKKLRYWSPSLIVVLFLGLPLVVGATDFINWKISARYFLGFTGAILSSVGIILYYKNEYRKLEQAQVRRYFVSAAISFGVYGIIGGLIVPKADFFPASMFNNDSFIALVGIPVQFFRAICAIGIAWSMWYIIDIFNFEESIVKESLIEKLNQAKVNLEGKVKKRTEELSQTNKLLKEEIVERKKAEEIIRRMAYYDSLTGLLNRKMFNDHFNMALANSERDGHIFALLFIDIDGFKQINDSFGHNVGDFFLKEVGKHLIKSVRKIDTAARIGGDEFAIIFTRMKTVEDAAMVADKMLKLLSMKYSMNKHCVYSTASIGISVYPFDGRKYNILISKADKAMYTAKNSGGNQYRFYDNSIQQKAA